ncbi:MAG: EamA family transporter [Clostridia bacterium]|nr:EamA family transporter [Clostridia bacterium]
MKKRFNDLHVQEQLAHKIVRRTTIRGTVLTAVGAVLWSFSSACGQFLMQKKDFPPEWLASTRILLAGFLLTLIGIIRNPSGIKNIFKSGKAIITLILYGVLGFMLAQYSFLMGIEASNSATATVLQYTAPIIIVAIVCIRTRRLPAWTETVSIILAVTGVFLLSTHGNPSELAIKPAALIWGLLAAVGMVFFSLLPSKIIPKYGSITVTGLGMLFGGIAMLFVARPWNYTVHFDVVSVFAYIGLAVMGTTVGYTLYMQGVSDIGSAKASLIASIEPVTSTVFAAVLGTMFGVMDIIGIACIVATIFILSIPPKKLHISFHPTHRKHKKQKGPSGETEANGK